jgi:hypothetical protein
MIRNIRGTIFASWLATVTTSQVDTQIRWLATASVATGQ